jgi:hypothetical protein
MLSDTEGEGALDLSVARDDVAVHAQTQRIVAIQERDYRPMHLSRTSTRMQVVSVVHAKGWIDTDAGKFLEKISGLADLSLTVTVCVCVCGIYTWKIINK